MSDLSQSYWPIGDIFPTTPQSSDFKVTKSITADPTDETTRYLDVVTSLGNYWSITLTFVDLGVLVDDATDDIVPVGFDHLSSRIWKDWGFGLEYSFDMVRVLDVDSVWQGDVLISLPVATQRKLGVNTLWNFEVDLWLTDPEAGSGTYQVKGLIGTVVVRR